MARNIVVVGAGISGLAVSYELVCRSERVPEGLEVQCFEAAERPGGNIRTVSEQGFVYEWAANGFLDAPPTLDLVRRLGLEERLVRASADAARRYVWRRGRLRRVPLSPTAFLRSDVLSWPGKLRVLAEPLIPARRTADDETIHDFARRRIGSEAADVLADAMVSGVYAGNSHELSLAATFPRLREMEQRHGSLFRALLARRREASHVARSAESIGPAGTLTSFASGMQELPAALARTLGPRLHLGTPVSLLSDRGARGLRVHPASGAPIEAAAVVLACPAAEAARLVCEMDAELSEHLAAIPSAPIAVVHLGYSREALGRQPEGLGFLVPRGQGPRILGALWSSNIFPGRAPERSVLVTVMIGGAHEPRAIDLADAELRRIAGEDLLRVLDVPVQPWFSRVLRQRSGIPQYDLGHLARLGAIDRRLARAPALHLAGNSYRGISVNHCIEEAPRIADAILAHLAARAPALAP